MTHQPHLTPRSLVGRRFPPDVFGGVRIAIVGYCPAPSVLKRYSPTPVTDQHFIHVSPASVRLLSHGGIRLLSREHVYGGPVSSALLEELAYYGVDVVLAYGLAGGLGTKGLGMGDYYVVADAIAADGTTPHYSSEPVQRADAGLLGLVSQLWPAWTARAGGPGAEIHPVRAVTGDALYREDDQTLRDQRGAGADIVNLDSSHLFAVARTNAEGHAMAAIQCGVLSDVVSLDGGEHESTLATMLADGADGATAPLERCGDIVAFYVEALAPAVGVNPSIR